MRREVLTRLSDIVTSAEAILRYTTARTLADYQSDEMLRDAVERRFMIIGEALREALRQEPSLSDRITRPREILAFRNVLVHGYATVISEAVWRIIHTHLPLLLTEVRALLSE